MARWMGVNKKKGEKSCSLSGENSASFPWLPTGNTSTARYNMFL